MQNEDAENILKYSVARECSQLAKQFLQLLEDIQQQHDIAFDKLYKYLPRGYENSADLVNYLDEDHFQYYRKKILDYTNDKKREIHKELEKYEIQFAQKERYS